MIEGLIAALALSSLTSAPIVVQNKKPAPPVAAPAAQRKVVSPADLFKAASPYIVTIKTEDSTGTGFVAPNGLVYTAYHVIQGKKNIKAVFPDKREIPLAWVVAMNPQQDWVGFHSTETSRLTFSTGDAAEVGSKVVVIGSPRGLEQTITEGLMSGKRTVGPASLLQVSAAVSPGSSGSPLFDQYGDVVGLVSSKLGESEQLAFAVPVSEFRNRIGVPIAALSGEQADADAVDAAEEFQLAYVKWHADRLGKVDPTAEDLTGLTSIKLKIYLNDDAKRYISEAELEAHARTTLRLQCPKLVVLDDDSTKAFLKDVSDKLDPKSALDRLVVDYFRWDVLTRALTISIESLNSDPASCYTVDTMLRRGATGLSGRVIADVFKDGAFGVFGSLVDVKQTWKNAVARHIANFARLWERANPDVK